LPFPVCKLFYHAYPGSIIRYGTGPAAVISALTPLNFAKFLLNNSFDDVIIVADEFLDSILRDLKLESKIKTYKYTDDIIEHLP
jgi:hypothetical protein